MSSTPERDGASPARPGTAPPTYADVLAAAGRLEGLTVETPLLRADALDAAAGSGAIGGHEQGEHSGNIPWPLAHENLFRAFEHALEADDEVEADRLVEAIIASLRCS